jgi:hypothetical protein
MISLVWRAGSVSAWSERSFANQQLIPFRTRTSLGQIDVTTVRFVYAFLMIGALAALSGCSDSGAKSLALDEALAKASLTKTLDAWKAGQSSESLKSQDPAINTNDWAWDQGYQLKEYRLLGGDRSDGANLHCPVELSVVDKQKRLQKQAALFVVGTSPVITVFRQ